MWERGKTDRRGTFFLVFFPTTIDPPFGTTIGLEANGRIRPLLTIHSQFVDYSVSLSHLRRRAYDHALHRLTEHERRTGGVRTKATKSIAPKKNSTWLRQLISFLNSISQGQRWTANERGEAAIKHDSRLMTGLIKSTSTAPLAVPFSLATSSASLSFSTWVSLWRSWADSCLDSSSRRSSCRAATQFSCALFSWVARRDL